MQALWDVGPSRFDGGVEDHITWQELSAYARAMECLADPRELRTVMDMSKAYVAERRAGVDPFRISPVDRKAAKNG